MVKITDGSIDLDVLEVEDIIDVKVLKNFLDNFALGMNCAAVSVDREGKEITAPSHYRPFCNQYVHQSVEGDNRCAACHNQFGEMAVKQNRPYVSTCHAGLIDFAAPIMVRGTHLGTVLGGQILDDAPNENNIRKVAREIGVDEESLWEAGQKIDILNRKNIEAAAEVLYIVTNQLAEEGYQQLEIKLLSNDFTENFLQISQTVEVLAESAQSITTDQFALTEQIRSINEIAGNITTVLKSVEQIANNIKLIGLNASIEAARLGEAGRGFSVVAKEIQNLSNRSKETTVEISKMNEQITTNVSATIENANNTLSTTENQSSAMEELSATVQNVVTLAEKLQDIFVKEK